MDRILLSELANDDTNTILYSQHLHVGTVEKGSHGHESGKSQWRHMPKSKP